MAQPLLNSQAEIVQALLLALNLGTAPPEGQITDNSAWPVYVSNEPDYPDNCISVFDTANKALARLMPTGEEVQVWGFRVRIRSVDHPTGYPKAAAIWRALNQSVGGFSAGIRQVVTINGNNTYRIGACINVTGPRVQGKDVPNTKRSIFYVDGFLVI